jgi:hypothetical protein
MKGDRSCLFIDISKKILSSSIIQLSTSKSNNILPIDNPNSKKKKKNKNFALAK